MTDAMFSLRHAFFTGMGLLLLTPLGCDSSVRREGLGGGALAPVKVTLLRDGSEGGEEATQTGGGAGAGPKIEDFGTFRGRIVVTGAVPTFPAVAQQAAMQAAMCPGGTVADESAIVGPDGGLANVFVYLRRVPNVDVPPPPTEPVVLDQIDCKFIPHAYIVQVGQPLHLINSDPVAHNVMFTASTFSFNNTLTAKDAKGMTIEFQRAERFPIPSSCSFHGWMQAYQMVVDHPWAALSQPDGTFVIENAPAGPMEFVFWHEKLGYIDKGLKVEIPANGEVEKTLEVTGSALAGK